MRSGAHPILALSLFVFLATTAAVSIGAFRRRRHSRNQGPGSALLGSGLRAWYFEQLQPFEDSLVRAAIAPAWLTWAQLAMSVVVAACYAAGMLFTGGWLLLFTGSLDILDGRLARRAGSASARGAFLDSVIDRYADALAFMGLAILFRDSAMLWVVLLALLGTQMVSYTRARGEALGAACTEGALQRPERYVLLGFGTILGALVQHVFGSLGGRPYALVDLVLVGLAVAVHATAIQRAMHVWRALAGR